MNGITILQGDALEVLRTLPDESVHCVVTSPPYWGLRDYGCEGQIGLEDTLELYIDSMRGVFAEVWRVLRADGTIWLNLGDSYNSGNKGNSGEMHPNYKQSTNSGSLATRRGTKLGGQRNGGASGLCKPKDLCGIPWRVAFALQADGWYLRSDIIWHKPNPMPESVTDRPTKSHEYIFLMSKSERYYYNTEAIREEATCERMRGPGPMVQPGTGRNDVDMNGDYRNRRPKAWDEDMGSNRTLVSGYPRKIKVPGGWDRGEGAHGTIHRDGRTEAEYQETEVKDGRNKRSVWTVATQPFPEAHFATFPEELIKPCILAGCPAGGTVLDPFGGSGTTALVARANGCKAILIELNPEYIEIAKRRLAQEHLEFV